MICSTRHATKIQVVVITCRPLDYLREEDMPTGDDSVAVKAGGLVRAINLERMVDRVVQNDATACDA